MSVNDKVKNIILIGNLYCVNRQTMYEKSLRKSLKYKGDRDFLNLTHLNEKLTNTNGLPTDQRPQVRRHRCFDFVSKDTRTT